jgi:hypothetical protein
MIHGVAAGDGTLATGAGIILTGAADGIAGVVVGDTVILTTIVTGTGTTMAIGMDTGMVITMEWLIIITITAMTTADIIMVLIQAELIPMAMQPIPTE